MRKVLKICICSLLFMQLVILTGCRAKHAIQFIVDNEEYYTIKTKGKEEISMPEDPTKSGYIFDGWYFDERGWKKPLTRDTFLDQKLEDDKKVYAKWKSVIKTIDDLKSIRNDRNLIYILTTDIDLGGIEWTPIDFSGEFDGNNHIIKNFKITNTNSSNNYGLFGKNTGVIYDLGVEDFEVSVKSTNRVFVGGLVGKNLGFSSEGRFEGTISNSYAIGTVTATSYDSYAFAGGLVGYSEGGTISNSYATGTVTATSASSDEHIFAYAGGLVGSNEGYGGVDNFKGTISNSYAIGNVTAKTSFGAIAGGLVGYNSFTISNSYATGDVTVTSTSTSYDSSVSAGGLVGYNRGGTINNSYATGNVNSSSKSATSAGGLVGRTFGDLSTISNSYATGNVTATSSNNDDFAGGLVGFNDSGTISNSYATGDVTATSTSTSFDQYAYAGGLVGFNDSGIISNSYRYSGQIIKSNKNNMNTEGVAKSMEELTSVSFYTNTLGWDESIWEFTEGSFPKLKK